MSLRSCGNCEETVDPAKAFCPGCGSPLVAETKRAVESEFEATGNTVQFSQSAFNMVLSDMGLNISEAPHRPVKTAEKIFVEPVGARAVPSTRAKSGISGMAKWFVIACVAVVVISGLLIVAGAFGFYFYTKQT